MSAGPYRWKYRVPVFGSFVLRSLKTSRARFRAVRVTIIWLGGPVFGPTVGKGLNRCWFFSQFKWNYIILCHAAVLMYVASSTMQICQKEVLDQGSMPFRICLRWWCLLERCQTWFGTCAVLSSCILLQYEQLYFVMCFCYSIWPQVCIVTFKEL